MSSGEHFGIESESHSQARRFDDLSADWQIDGGDVGRRPALTVCYRTDATKPMISLDPLVCRAYGGASLEEMLREDSPLATSMPGNTSDRGGA